MKSKNEKNTSVWFDTFKLSKHYQLKKNIETDICIVGGGITGLTAGYLLANEGKKIVIIDEGGIGNGETGRTTAHLSNVLDWSFPRLEKIYGQKNCRLIAQSHTVAIDTIEKIIKKEKIDCDFKRVDGYLFFQPDDPANLLEEEYETAQNTGINVEIIPKPPFEFFNSYPCLKFPGQAQFHILKYISKLADSIIQNGGRIFTRTYASSIEDGTTVKIKTKNKYVVKAKEAIVSTHSPASNYVSIHTKQVPYRTYVIGFETPRNSVKTALYWDNEEPYHYIRIYSENNNDILIVGGEDHKTGQEENPEERFKTLEAWARERFKSIQSIMYKWSGQVLQPIDGLSFIGKDPENSQHVYIATGFSGNGMTYGTMAGLLLRDLILGRDNEWAELYSPDRITMKETPALIKGGLETYSQYARYLTPGDVGDIKEIKKGQGAVLRDGLEKIAVYRDEKGKIHKFSAVCPHLKCIVQWNSFEKSWDCPCHGSRFNALGKVINGPALADLEKYKASVVNSKT